ncbi:hypothetical protein [Helicobacter sp. 11S03491-1]|uniref:hypothetical protein n=1 Tax=Helicobacter sp. 11S03491-1 TaxID=1476196 RepID=UPI000BA648A1|nr:hypothetical protein [Helicobacter sp. 11S03491-1]PAF43335.1 hypothetical protein BKH45_01465 [Helicobacter sp. 11S03491-1]
MEDLKQEIDLVLISVNSPLKCGVYRDLKLQKVFSSVQKTGDALMEVFSEIFAYTQKHNLGLRSIFYARGPGSFTSLKLTHIFLQTLALSQSIHLYSTSSFYFNQNAPIKAFGNKYFIRNSLGEIELVPFKQEIPLDFSLPKMIDLNAFDTQNIPMYILPPI